MSDVPLTVAVIGTVTPVVAGTIPLILGRINKRQEAAERRRLEGEILVLTDSPDAQVPPGQSPEGETPSKGIQGEARDLVYDRLLINDYALGLTQARRAFNVSMSFSILGGVVLIFGIGLAIFRAETRGQIAGAAITSAAGVLTSGLSQLFRDQSTRALRHLESQAVELRKDVRAQVDSGTALRLLEEISDNELRSHLQAALILKFTGAVLPNLKGSSGHSKGDLNGDMHGLADSDGAQQAEGKSLP
jgi:hypothetical protein